MHSDTPVSELKEGDVMQQAISDYISSMSHDLKTPLVAIVGIGEILKNELKDNTEYHKLLGTLENATHTVLSLVKDILSLTRIESGHMQVLYEPFDLLRLIEGVVSTMSHQCLEKGVELLISYPPMLPRILISDSSAIRRIIINLLSNAVKFTDHGHIMIKVIKESLTDTSAGLNIVIEDTGAGIPESCVNKDFKSCSPQDLQDAQLYQGAGLTIAIVKQLIQGIGGQLQLQNVMGKGAKFTCSIPFALKKVNMSYLPYDNKHHPLKILIISNNPFSYRIIERVLERNWVLTCSADECLEILEEAYLNNRAFNIVIVDDILMNPTLLNVADQAKLKQWTQKTLFIYSSFPLNLTQVDLAKKSGFHEIINKPILPSQFADQLYAAWEKNILNPKAENLTEKIKKIDVKAGHIPKKTKKNFHRYPQILLVEDNAIVGEITKRILANLKCEVDLAENGIEALKLCKSNHYDLIFLDIDLPDIDGITICRIIRAQAGPNQETVIIALSGQIAEKEAGVCIAAGMNTFMEKPATSANFTQIINRYLINQQKNAA